MGVPGAKDVESFYRAAFVGLGALEARSGRARRFGPDAEATWKAFRGELADPDRVDLLIRDAAATVPAAFSPRVVFRLPGLAPDEPFGPDWPGAPPGLAATLLRTGAGGQNNVGELLALAASAWELRPRSLSPAVLDRVRPATRILVAGAGAIVSLAEALAGRAGFDIADQAVVVTDSPSERHLFGLAAMFLESTARVRTLSTGATAGDARAVELERVDLTLLSDDATGDQRVATDRLATALGG